MVKNTYGKAEKNLNLEINPPGALICFRKNVSKWSGNNLSCTVHILYGLGPLDYNKRNPFSELTAWIHIVFERQLSDILGNVIVLFLRFIFWSDESIVKMKLPGIKLIIIAGRVLYYPEA